MREFPVFEFVGAPMEEEQMAFLLGLLDAKTKEIPMDQQKAFDGEFICQVFLKRIKGYQLQFMVSDFFFVMSIKSNMITSPGDAMILLRLCYQYWKKTNKTLLGIEDWATIFPWGVPTREEMQIMWEVQKQSGESLGNMIDNPTYWQ